MDAWGVHYHGAIAFLESWRLRAGDLYPSLAVMQDHFKVMTAALIIHKGITAVQPIQAFVVATVDDILNFGLSDFFNTDMVAARAP